MKTKATIFLGAVVILSTAFAFTTSTQQATPVVTKEETTISNTSSGFVLEDPDQWK
jgi:hypothetical protein